MHSAAGQLQLRLAFLAPKPHESAVEVETGRCVAEVDLVQLRFNAADRLLTNSTGSVLEEGVVFIILVSGRNLKTITNKQTKKPSAIQWKP